MTVDLPDEIDFSDMDKFCPSLAELNDLANSLTSEINDSELDDLLNRPSPTDPAPITASFDTNDPSVRVTIRLASDVWKAYRHSAVRRGMPYQTLINDTLRRALPNL